MKTVRPLYANEQIKRSVTIVISHLHIINRNDRSKLIPTAVDI